MDNIFAFGAFKSRLLVSFAVVAFATSVNADTLTIIAKFDGSAFRTEVEIVGSPMAYTGVAFDTPVGTVALEPDAGETQWDFESDNISLAELNAAVTAPITFRFFTDGGATESIYSLAAPTTADLATGDFPVRATSLDVTLSANPLRPTATWAGGDPSADALFLTYQDLVTFDEFGDPSLDPSTNPTSYTLQQDLLPGTYEAALGFWTVFSMPALSLQSGPEVFFPEADEVFFVLAGETLFSPVDIVPIPLPAAGLLFPFALLAARMLRRRR
ncbi:MAG: hypothetical protein ACR2QV_03230 [Gammaproteobacteria bacterium]